MNGIIRHIRFLFAAAVCCAVLSACHVENYREICDYKVQLRYDYNEENSSGGVNKIEYYVNNIDEYIFDERGILLHYRRFTAARCKEYLNSEIDLPPGQYSVIAIGNIDDRSTVWDAQTGIAPVESHTHREDMRMTLTNATAMPGDTKGPCEPLYYGYRTFTVKEQGISRIRVDMIHAHLKLRFRVTWKNTAAPARDEGYYSTLESIPSEYALMPQYYYPAGSFACQGHDPSQDTYPSSSNDVIHHIPYTCRMDGAGQPINLLKYRCDTKVNADWEMWGDFTAYRIKTETGLRLRILGADGQSILPKGNDIDLQAYFAWYSYELDHTLRQEYELDIVVDGETIYVNPLRIGDWDEGGKL